VAAGADGVHLTSNSISADVIKKTFGPDLLIGASTHSLPELSLVKEKGADFAVFGPVFKTKSKAGYGEPVGLDMLREVASAVAPFPVLALGGIDLTNVYDCIEAGASGIAAIGLFDNIDLNSVVVELRAKVSTETR
jgi:thiamine-phosphate pyrophosphorylase